MPNRRTSDEKVERRTMSFAPDYWEGFKRLCLSYGLAIHTKDGIKGVTVLFRAFYLTYMDNKSLIEPLLLQTIDKYNLKKEVNQHSVKER